MPARTLAAFANRVRVGTLRDEHGVWSFTYDAAWIASPDAFPLSPAFALREAPFIDDSSNRAVQWFFDNLLPEEDMRTALAREAKVDAGDAWGLLAYFGRESAGALTLLPENAEEAAGGELPLPLDQLEARIQAMPKRALTATAPKRMSAAGAQQKLLLILRGEAPHYELFEPVGSEPSMHLLKPDMRTTGYPHSAANEYFCMRLAKAMGLDVPKVHFLRAPSACYVVDRFDRDMSTQPATRLHTIDAMQLLNYDRSFKYQKANAEVLNEAVGKTSGRAAARLAIFRWTIFNVLIGNADAHLKNLSFFASATGYRLAPFYDLVSTVVYHTLTYRGEPGGDDWPRCELTMPLGGATLFSEVTRKGMIAFAEELGLPARGAAKQLDDFLGQLDAAVEETSRDVAVAVAPTAGEARLLNAIVTLPLREMSQALRT